MNEILFEVLALAVRRADDGLWYPRVRVSCQGNFLYENEYEFALGDQVAATTYARNIAQDRLWGIQRSLAAEVKRMTHGLGI